jgi:hypothetical protein
MQLYWSRLARLPSGQIVLLALVLLLGIGVRVAQFSHIPAGLNQDEAASAYESFSLAETGQDKWGNILPAYFPAWGSGQNVLLAYLSAPIIKVLGLSVLSARLVPLLLGILTLPLLFGCLRPVGRFPALLGTLLLALMPWHFMLSRWALESNLVPFCMLLGCFSLSRAFITGRRRWIVPCLLPFALSLYAYGTTAVVLPPMFALLLLLGFGRLRQQWGSWLLALGLFLLAATPFLLFFTENYIIARNLAWTDALFFSTPLLPATRISQVAGAHWTDIVGRNLDFLINSFDDGTCYNLMPGYKPLLSFTLPFALLGAVVGSWKLIRRRGRVFYSPATIVLAIFGVWGLASLGLFCSVELNVNRFNHFYLPCLVLAVWVISLAINNFLPTVPRPALRLAVTGWLLLEGGLAVDHYFTEYRTGPIKSEFNDGLGEAFAAVEGLWGMDQVRITNQMPLPYVYALFYLRYPPVQFQREAKVEVIGGVYQVRRFGRYIFNSDEIPGGSTYGYLSRKNEYGDLPRQVLFTNDAWEVGVVKPAAVSH